MHNPILVELTRGAGLESVHRGALVLARANGEVLAAVGDVDRPIFPRSAIKPLQALPLLETGAADRYGFGNRELAIACGSHSGTPEHTAVVGGMLSRVGLDAAALGCGVQEPLDGAAARQLVRAGRKATQLNHNCSGKHAAMLATARHHAEAIDAYWLPTHPVQLRIHHTLEAISGQDLTTDACGIDGCSVPNWAMPLTRLATAFARFVSGEDLSPARAETCRRVAQACWAEPTLVAGAGRLDTMAMAHLPGRVLLKAGAEGVHCGGLVERGLGFALKIDDGGKRAADLVTASLVACACGDVPGLPPSTALKNFRGLTVGEMRPAAALAGLLHKLA